MPLGNQRAEALQQGLRLCDRGAEFLERRDISGFPVAQVRHGFPEQPARLVRRIGRQFLLGRFRRDCRVIGMRLQVSAPGIDDAAHLVISGSSPAP
jgi:hypothetical protein